jgi:hypothetical protein
VQQGHVLGPKQYCSSGRSKWLQGTPDSCVSPAASVQRPCTDINAPCCAVLRCAALCCAVP